MLLRNLCKIRSFNNIVPIRFNRKIYTRSSSQPLCRINFEKTRFKGKAFQILVKRTLGLLKKYNVKTSYPN